MEMNIQEFTSEELFQLIIDATSELTLRHRNVGGDKKKNEISIPILPIRVIPNNIKKQKYSRIYKNDMIKIPSRTFSVDRHDEDYSSDEDPYFPENGKMYKRKLRFGTMCGIPSDNDVTNRLDSPLKSSTRLSPQEWSDANYDDVAVNFSLDEGTLNMELDKMHAEMVKCRNSGRKCTHADKTITALVFQDRGFLEDSYPFLIRNRPNYYNQRALEIDSSAINVIRSMGLENCIIRNAKNDTIFVSAIDPIVYGLHVFSIGDTSAGKKKLIHDPRSCGCRSGY